MYVHLTLQNKSPKPLYCTQTQHILKCQHQFHGKSWLIEQHCDENLQWDCRTELPSTPCLVQLQWQVFPIFLWILSSVFPMHCILHTTHTSDWAPTLLGICTSGREGSALSPMKSVPPMLRDKEINSHVTHVTIELERLCWSCWASFWLTEVNERKFWPQMFREMPQNLLENCILHLFHQKPMSIGLAPFQYSSK